MATITSKITKIDGELASRYKTVHSMIEAGEMLQSCVYEMTIHLENGSKIIFHDTDSSNGSNKVTISLPEHLEE